MLTQRTAMGCLVAAAVVMGMIIVVLLLMLAGIVPLPFGQTVP
jgi:hypothetical protein